MAFFIQGRACFFCGADAVTDRANSHLWMGLSGSETQSPMLHIARPCCSDQRLTDLANPKTATFVVASERNR